MEQFTTDFIALRDRMEAALPAAFSERERGVIIADHGCALAAGFSLKGERKMFGIIGTGSFTHSHEERLLFSAPGLTAGDLPAWRDYAARVVKERIHLDRAHEFSIFSFILVTDHADRALIRGLKKLDIQAQYSEPNAGWSHTRCLLIDLGAKKMYPSPLGKPLVELMRGLL